jgi:hypothetical protein
MKLKKGSKEARDFMAKIRAKKKGTKKPIKKSALKKAVKKVATKKAVKRIAGEKHTDNKSHNYKINISGLDFFEKNRLEYNKYDHLTIYRNYRGRDSAKLNNKVIALKKAYNLIDKGEYKFYNQINLGSMLAVDYRKLK